MNTYSTSLQRSTDNFLKRLISLSEDRGTMAELRCLLTPDLRHRGWQAVASLNGLKSPVRMLIAGLFALHPQHDPKLGNFGSSCRALANSHKRKEKTGSDNSESNALKNSPLDIYFRRLLDADFNELCDLLPKLIRRLKSESIPINYEKLYKDLNSWEKTWGDNKYPLHWAQEYWKQTPENDSDHDTPVSE